MRCDGVVVAPLSPLHPIQTNSGAPNQCPPCRGLKESDVVMICCRLFVQGGDVKACIDNCGFGGGGGHKGVAIVRRYKGGPGIEVFAVGELRFEGLSNSMQYF